MRRGVIYSFSFEEKVPNACEADEVIYLLSPHPDPLLKGEGTKGNSHG